jgi:hydroxymethylbilane synthase
MPELKPKIIIGSRGSELALWQSRQVQRLLEIDTEIKIIKTEGDRFLDAPLQGQLEKGFFTKEIEQLMLKSEIDLAVHSLKDLPTEIDPRLTIGAYLKRGPVSDLLLVRPEEHDGNSLFPVKSGCVVGATSLRRQAMLKYFAPHSTPAMLRGNVPTRVKKLKQGLFGAIVLARAGVERLGLDLKPLMAFELNPEIWLPAPGQGVIAIETRADAEQVLAAVSKLDDKSARDAASLERRLLANFEGGCHTAFGALARPEGKNWKVIMGMEHAQEIWVEFEVDDAYEELLSKGPETIEFFKHVKLKTGEELCRPLPW